MRPRTLQRMTSSTRSSPKSTTTRTTRSLLRAGSRHDPHSREHASRVSMGGGYFSLSPGLHLFKGLHLLNAPRTELRTDLTDVLQALLLRDPGSRPHGG